METAFVIACRILALVVLTSIAPDSALARLPWAATSGIHFVEAIVAADNYRAKAGGLAMKKSSSPELREFGRALWIDSIENKRRLSWLLNRHQPYQFLPTQIAPRDMFVIDKLIPVSGENFDRRYIAQQTNSLRTTLALTQGYARAGDDLYLKEFAARSVARLQKRLDQILEIERQRG